MSKQVDFMEALRRLLAGQIIYSEVSQTTFELKGDVVLTVNRYGADGVLERMDELFTLDEVLGGWTCRQAKERLTSEEAYEEFASLFEKQLKEVTRLTKKRFKKIITEEEAELLESITNRLHYFLPEGQPLVELAELNVIEEILKETALEKEEKVIEELLK